MHRADFITAGIFAALSISIATAQIADVPNGLFPYRFERINEHNFHSQGWMEQEVNSPPGMPQQFLNGSEHLKIVCGPNDDHDPRLIKGAVTMNLPTSSFPTLRRIRLRRAGYSGTYLSDLVELGYSTYVSHGFPTVMVLHIDVNGDETKDFNIYYAPEEQGGQQFERDIWQQWNALQGVWHFEAVTIPGLPPTATIEELVELPPDARIIDTPPVGHNGEGVRFTVGGGPTPSNYFDNVSYLDQIIIGTADRNRSTMFDFACNASQD